MNRAMLKFLFLTAPLGLSLAPAVAAQSVGEGVPASVGGSRIQLLQLPSRTSFRYKSNTTRKRAAGFAQAPPSVVLRDATVHTPSAEQLSSAHLTTSLTEPLLPLVEERKSPFAAFGLELVFPILGHGYAGNGKRGVLPAAVHVGGFVAMLALDLDADPTVPTAQLDSRCQRTTASGPGGFTSKTICKASGAFWVAVGAFVGGRIWGLVSAVRTANEHNRSVGSENPASLSVLPTPDGRLGVGMTLRF